LANILVYIERSAGRPAAASLEVLGEARRVASLLGATLYAVLPGEGRLTDPDAALVLGQHGADKVLVAGRVDPALPLLHATHGHLLAAACARVPAALVLLAATPGGQDLAPRAAARLGAAYVPEATVELGDGELVLWRAVFGGSYRRRLAAHDVERPLVVTLAPGAGRRAHGRGIAETLPLDVGAPAGGVEEVRSAPDPAAGLERAAIVVTAGGGVGPEVYAQVRALAAALGGEVAVTRAAVERGLDSSDREVGVGGRRVAPRLYLACAASGSAEHLAAVGAGARIVAINRDPRAPIFRAAAYGLVGDVAEVVPGLIAAARRRGARA
jgi:electron transfer flavoprotein alpha subunit